MLSDFDQGQSTHFSGCFLAHVFIFSIAFSPVVIIRKRDIMSNLDLVNGFYSHSHILPRLHSFLPVPCLTFHINFFML